MPLKTIIKGANQDYRIREAQVHDDGTWAGLVAFTHPLINTDTQFAPFLNEEYGEDINQNAGFGGSPELVHDGEDTTLWTGSNIIGSRITFNNTTRPRTGTRSIQCNRPLIGDVWQFDKGSDLTVTNYTALTMWINIDSNWRDGTSSTIYAWDTGAGQIVGNTVTLESFVDEFQFDVWQKAVIPFTDLGLSTTDFDAIRMSFVAHAGGTRPRWFIDDFQVEETGTPLTFRTETPRGVKYNIDSITFTFVDATTDTSLSYDKILGQSQLPNGILLRRTVADEVTFATSITNLHDFLKLGFDVTNYHADGTNAILTVQTKFPSPLFVMGGPNSAISVTISDDLTGFVKATVAARGSIEL